jgi:CRISPR-associated endonuclease/helicase Cas3
MPTRSEFEVFFQTATGGHTPYAYQRRLAGDLEATMPSGPFPCASQLINIPTGLGKTAAVVLAWLWNRVAQPNAAHRDTWPRRLVICLPMRTLVDQTESVSLGWLKALDLSETVGVHILMGGEDRAAMRDWDLHPERPAILIGTQDMLLSRALNRGYGLSRYRWPMHFALLNNDSLWVFDELQLMGVSVETSAQLSAFRQKLGLARGCHSWWMSATLDAKRLLTVDHAQFAAALSPLELSLKEKESEPVKRRIASIKKLLPIAQFALSRDTEKTYEKQLVDFILSAHETGTFTLVIVNRVPRAREIFHLLQKAIAKHAESSRPKLALVHSRFRPKDRAKHTTILTDRAITHKIVIATQAVEAGVDVSAKTLVAELAPWSSLVQRFGRCNRAGEHVDTSAPATIHWIDIDPKGKDDLALPYEIEELAAARAALQSLTDAGPAPLAAVSVAPRAVIRPVIRRKDFIELFDTTPDIAGHDLDISRYIREGDDTDAQVAWRDFGTTHSPTPNDPRPGRGELCRVPVHALNDFLRKQRAEAFVWNPLACDWESQRSVRPGAVCLLDVEMGGYDDTLGWTADKKSRPTPLPPPFVPQTPVLADESGYGDSTDAQVGCWQTIADHTAEVETQLNQILAALVLPPADAQTLREAARLHDIGKAHPNFQALLIGADLTRRGTLWAKSPEKTGQPARPLFRHELASALALLAHPELIRAPSPDLVAYLVAAHHGKVRLSIRSLPGEKTPPSVDQRFARGIWENDSLPAIPLSDGDLFPATTLSLACMELGSRDDGKTRSWLACMLALRDAPNIGPLRLAWLEALLRAADMRASALAGIVSTN